MRIIGVIDLLQGQAVHARGGCRQAYRAVERCGATVIAGDPVRLADAYISDLALGELYVADLDAIAGGPEQDEGVRRLTSAGVPIWLDAGVSSVAQAQRAIDRGTSRVVVGLETLPSFAALRDISVRLGGECTVFSLDLRDGRPIAGSDPLRELSVESLARHAAVAGASAVIVLDLARIGSSRGIDVRMLERVRAAVPGLELLAGGGIRGAGDMRLLAEAGVDGALVATALHAADAAHLVEAAASLGHGKVTR